MSLRFHYETPDPAKPGTIKDVFIDVPDEVRFHDDPEALKAFDVANRVLYPEPSTDELLAAGRITQSIAEKRRKAEAAAQGAQS